MRRPMDRRYVMVRASIDYNGKTDIQFIHGRMNNSSYLNLIKDQISKHVKRIMDFMFQ